MIIHLYSVGCVKGTQAKIYIDSTATPKVCRARTVPYAIQDKVEREINRLEREGVITPVSFSEWAAPVVSVVKNDGSIRICGHGDHKITVNRVKKVDTYPLPRIDDLLASLSGGKSFTKLDLAHAYQQVALVEESRNTLWRQLL